MLTRKRTILSLLTQVAKPLPRTVFVKLVFLLRHETTLKDVSSFMDTQIGELRERLEPQIGELRERIVHLEGLLEGLREAITRRIAGERHAMKNGLKSLWDLIERRRLVSAESGSESERSTRTSEGISKEFAVSDPVWIRVDGRRVDGHISKKARTHCLVVAEGGELYKAPWPLVFARSDADRKHVTTRIEKAKARFRADDQVEFTVKGTTLQGKIVRLNPKRAVVVCGNHAEWRVPYRVLVRISPERKDEPREVLKAVAARARHFALIVDPRRL